MLGIGREKELDRLIEQMRETVQQTKATYYRAKREAENARALELKNPNSNGILALDQALSRQVAAHGDFRKAVMEFTRLLLYGKEPGEPDDQNPRDTDLAHYQSIRG